MFEKQSEANRQQSISQLLGISQAMGVLKWIKPGVYTNFKLAFYPFISTNVYHQMLGNYQIQWHNLFFSLAQDKQFLQHLLTPAAQKDPMVEKMLNILKKKTNKNKDGICFTRIDYYNDQAGQPKLTQYNLYSVGMQSNMEQYQQAKKIHENDKSYVDCQTIDAFTATVKEMMKAKKLNGLFIFVVHEKFKDEPNFLDQTRFEIKLRQADIKVVRSTLRQMADMVTISEQNNLLFNSQPVSFVYYRTGYQLQQYSFEEGYDPQRSWKVKQQVQLSNAIAIPSIEFELINLKRVQTELNKPEVLHKYIGISESEMLQKTRVRQLQFDSLNTEKLEQLIKQVKIQPSKYILKANRQGGGNNLFGDAALKKLEEATLQQLRHYIMMEKIESKIYRNIIFDGNTVVEEQCNYQISRYGVLSWYNGKISYNHPTGFLIRAKPTRYDEGGIMAGIGAIVPWKIQ